MIVLTVLFELASNQSEACKHNQILVSLTKRTKIRFSAGTVNSFVARLEKQHRSDVRLSERLASLGIMGAQLSAHLKPLGPSQHYGIEGFKGGP